MNVPPRKTADKGRHTETLFPLVYEELRLLAGQMMTRLPPGQTLQPTMLVHEAFLRLTRGDQTPWENRAHFFAAAAEAMRRILIEQARRKHSLKRGGNWTRTQLQDVQLATETAPDLLITINDALDQLAVEHPAKAELVKLRFFAGLNVDEAGETLGISPRTVKRHWAFARAWLYEAIRDEHPSDPTAGRPLAP